MHVTQVRQVHRIFGGFLGMTGKPEGSVSHFAPFGSARRILGKAPLRRPAVFSPPGEDHAEHFPRLEHPQTGGPGRRGKGGGNALAADGELEAVKRTDESGIAHPAPAGRTQVGTQVGTDRLSHADAARSVAPGHDLFAHPGLFNQFFPKDGFTAGNEVPTLGKRVKHVGDRVLLGRFGWHSAPKSCNLTATVPSALKG